MKTHGIRNLKSRQNNNGNWVVSWVAFCHPCSAALQGQVEVFENQADAIELIEKLTAIIEGRAKLIDSTDWNHNNKKVY